MSVPLIKKFFRARDTLWPGISDEWAPYHFSTQPADREQAEIGVNEAYRYVGLPSPQVFIWLDSPFAGGLAALVLKHVLKIHRFRNKYNRENISEEVQFDFREIAFGNSLFAPMLESLESQIERQANASLWEAGSHAYKPVKNRVWDRVVQKLTRQIENHIFRRSPNFFWDWVEADNLTTLDVTQEGAFAVDILRNYLANRGHPQFDLGLRDFIANRTKSQIDEHTRRVAWDRFTPYCSPHSNLNSIWRFGQFDGASLSLLRFFKEAFDLDGFEGLSGLTRISKSVGWWLPFGNIVILVDRPRAIEFDEHGRLHCDDNMALKYRDGWGDFFWKGVLAPGKVIMDPNRITTREIDAEMNVEVRRIMLERYGWDRYLLDSGATPIQKDKYGVLYRRELWSDESLVMVKVTNHSRNPDGTFQTYFLRVPPDIETAHEAVAWTFNTTRTHYRPSIQT